MNRALMLGGCILLIWGLSSCKLYHRITGKRTRNTDSSLVVRADSTAVSVDTLVAQQDSVIAIVDTAQQALIAALTPYWSAQTNWNTFNGKAKVHFEGKGESQDVAATIRMERGKSVWISVTALGLFEAARILIQPDTIRIINRINKEVKILPFSEAGSLMPVKADFNALQALIMGDVLQAGKQPNAAKDTAGELVLSYLSPQESHSIQFSMPDTVLHFQAISTDGTFMLSEYGDYQHIGSRRFANNRNLFLSDKEEQYNLSLEFSKAAFDEAVETPFSVPDKYERK